MSIKIACAQNQITIFRENLVNAVHGHATYITLWIRQRSMRTTFWHLGFAFYFAFKVSPLTFLVYFLLRKSNFYFFYFTLRWVWIWIWIWVFGWFCILVLDLGFLDFGVCFFGFWRCWIFGLFGLIGHLYNFCGLIGRNAIITIGHLYNAITYNPLE